MLIQKPNEIITATEYHVRMEHQENFKSYDELDNIPDSGITANICARHRTTSTHTKAIKKIIK